MWQGRNGWKHIFSNNCIYFVHINIRIRIIWKRSCMLYSVQITTNENGTYISCANMEWNRELKLSWVCFFVFHVILQVTNYFICNLAVGDILMSLFCVPFSFFPTLLLQYWPFGSLLCHLVNYSQAISVLVSAYTLVAISIDRYIAILWPLRPRITKR